MRIIALGVMLLSLPAFGQWKPEVKKVELPKPAVSTAKQPVARPVALPKPRTVEAITPKQ
jgi:hypothetical protein